MIEIYTMCDPKSHTYVIFYNMFYVEPLILL